MPSAADFVRSENLNAVFINKNMPPQEQLIALNKIAIQQMSVLQKMENRKLAKQHKTSQ